MRSTAERDRNLAVVGLAAILLIAALVRIWGLDFCLPGSMCRPDEEFNAGIGLSIAGGDLNPHFFNYPTLYFYALGLLDRLMLIYEPVRESVLSGRDVSPLLRAGRWFGAVCGCLTVLATFFLGRRLGGTRTGLIASAFLALNYLHVRDSHFMTVDVPVGLMATVALVFALRAMDRGGVGDFVAAGLAAGLATSTKYTVAVVGLSVVTAYGFALRARPQGRLRPPDRRLWLALAAMAAAALLTSPFVLLDFGTFVDQLGHEMRHFRAGFYPAEREVGTVVYYSTRILPHGFGIVPLLLALVAVVAWLRRRDRGGIVLLTFVVGYAIVIGGGTTVFARYLVPLMPPLCVAAAVGVDRLTASTPQRRRSAVACLVILLALAQPGWNTFRFDRLLATSDTRGEAARWIAGQFEPGTLLQVGGIEGHHWVLGPKDLPGFRIVNRSDEFQDHLLGVPLTELTRRGVRYVLTHEHPLIYSTLRRAVVDKLQAQAEQRICFEPFDEDGGKQALYDYEDAFYLPFARFAGVRQPGPEICVYDLAPGGTVVEK